MPEIRDCNRQIRDIAGVSTTEKDGNQKETRVGKLLQRDKLLTSS